MDDRYQFQPRYVQAYRWLRYVPYWYVCGLIAVARWWLFDRTIPAIDLREAYRPDDKIPPTRTMPLFKNNWQMANHIMQIHRSMASGKMKHYWTLREVLDGVRERMK